MATCYRCGEAIEIQPAIVQFVSGDQALAEMHPYCMAMETVRPFVVKSYGEAVCPKCHHTAPAYGPMACPCECHRSSAARLNNGPEAGNTEYLVLATIGRKRTEITVRAVTNADARQAAYQKCQAMRGTRGYQGAKILILKAEAVQRCPKCGERLDPDEAPFCENCFQNYPMHAR